jgi:hypothetical protein
VAFGDKGVRSLETARECALLGARKRTIAWITGLPPTFILRNVFDEDNPAPCGRPPYTEDFVFRAPLRLQAAASAFAVKYHALTSDGFTPACSLIAAFRHYRSFADAPAFCFDEAFYLVCNLDGIWACSARKLQLTRCRRCRSRHLAPWGSTPSQGCPFCKALQSSEMPNHGNPCVARRASSTGCVSQTFLAHVGALKTRRSLEALGAHARVIDALMSTMQDVPSDLRPAFPTQLVRIGKPLSLKRWGAALRTVTKIQYSVAATTYRRLTASGFCPEEAAVGAYRHVRSHLQGDAPLSFDRCFEVFSLLEGRWGVQAPELDLVVCSRCHSHHLVSRRDRTASACPFCLLIRYPDQYFRQTERSPVPQADLKGIRLDG